QKDAESTHAEQQHQKDELCLLYMAYTPLTNAQDGLIQEHQPDPDQANTGNDKKKGCFPGGIPAKGHANLMTCQKGRGQPDSECCTQSQGDDSEQTGEADYVVW